MCCHFRTCLCFTYHPTLAHIDPLSSGTMTSFPISVLLPVR